MIRPANGTVLPRYKLRAECESDVDLLLCLLERSRTPITEWSVEHSDPGIPDVDLVFACALPIEALRRAITEIEDGHVMGETIAPFDAYTGERTYDFPSTAG
jgi:hypothetical protein